ncbi:hypothetical protein SACC_29810 [Saccharolobus caldissimus]|uniref:Uncharacterized protein n=1 Tax=Saccharolobus caldissimus TaxID=1702097 RepID=A0AAQ4CVY3_9CREN|nr:hypothetical protein SACC_29810 [Saccharolobus caldissimus]
MGRHTALDYLIVLRGLEVIKNSKQLRKNIADALKSMKF